MMSRHLFATAQIDNNSSFLDQSLILGSAILTKQNIFASRAIHGHILDLLDTTTRFQEAYSTSEIAASVDY